MIADAVLELLHRRRLRSAALRIDQDRPAALAAATAGTRVASCRRRDAPGTCRGTASTTTCASCGCRRTCRPPRRRGSCCGSRSGSVASATGVSKCELWFAMTIAPPLKPLQVLAPLDRERLAVRASRGGRSPSSRPTRRSDARPEARLPACGSVRYGAIFSSFCEAVHLDRRATSCASSCRAC